MAAYSTLKVGKMQEPNISVLHEGDRLLTLKQVQKRIPKSRTTLWRWCKDGLFPKPVPLGKDSRAWVESEIDQYIEGLKEKRSSGRATA